MMRVASILSIIIVALSAPAFADDADLKKQIDQLTASYVEHWNKQDFAGVAALWAKDPIYVNVTSGPTQPVVATYEGMYKAGLSHLESSITRVESLAPDVAIGTGTFQFTGKNPSGTEVNTQGYITTAYVKEGGTWKLKSLMGAAKPAPAK
jgi:uncharacterized protein (TIGR02246 family)